MAPLKGPTLADYYMPRLEDLHDPLWRAETAVNAEKRNTRLKNKGKGKPKKGEGKRAQKGKK